MLAGIFPLFFLLARRGAGERAGSLIRLLAGTAIAATMASYIALPALEAYTYRVQSSQENVVRRAVDPLVGPLEVFSDAGPVGYGIGATHQAASTLVPGVVPGSWLEGLVAETESTRIMIELGPVGFLLHFIYRIALVLVVFSISLRSRSAGPRVLALGAGLFLLAHIPGAIVFNVYAGIYFWFFAGCALLAGAEEEKSTFRTKVPNEAAKDRRLPVRVGLGAR